VTIVVVTSPADNRIVLELQPGEPIHGTLHDQGGAAHVFRGWLELCAALDRAWQHASTEVSDDEREPRGRCR
jgi:hypothetical protein